MKDMFPDDTQRQASHEAIHYALYVMPRCSLEKELIAYMKQGKS